MMDYSWSVISYYPLRDRWSADPGLSQAAGHSQAAQASKVRKNPRTGPPSRACLWTLEWGRKPCQDDPCSGPGRAMPGMCGHWDPGDARSEPLLAWQPGDGWPSRHRPGRPDTHKLICQAGLFRTQYSHSAQHYQHKDALSRLLREQYYASESYSNSYPISVSVIVGKENSG